MADPAVFLDRDGTLIEDVGFPTRPEQIRILGGVARALAGLAHAGFKLVVVTNQSGIARGLLTEANLDRFHQALDDQLGLLGAHVDAYYACPHHPDPDEAARPDLAVECDCRKPRPGLILRGAEDLDIDLAASWMVGDAWRDVAAGAAAGIRTVKVSGVRQHEGARPDDVAPPTAEAADLEEAARIILTATRTQPSPQAEPEEAVEGPQDAEPAPPEEPAPVSEEPLPRSLPAVVVPAEPQPLDEAPGDELQEPPVPQTVTASCARCGQAISDAEIEDGLAGRRGGALLCAECLPHQPHGESASATEGETDLLRSVLTELRRLNRARQGPSLTFLRLLAYILQAAALFCGLVLTLVSEDKALFLQIAILAQLLVVTLLLLERRS